MTPGIFSTHPILKKESKKPHYFLSEAADETGFAIAKKDHSFYGVPQQLTLALTQTSQFLRRLSSSKLVIVCVPLKIVARTRLYEATQGWMLTSLKLRALLRHLWQRREDCKPRKRNEARV